MKKKIVINVPMHGDKAKSKAMKIAVAIQGVTSVSLGEESDRLVVIGEGVDSVCLVNLLRKKFCFADIVTLEEVKPPAPASSDSDSDSAPSSPHKSAPPPPPPYYCPPPPLYYDCRPVYDPNCCIM